MKFLAFFDLAIKSILSNKLRSVLTMLGIIIGVGAVITLMSMGSGFQAWINSSFEQMGTNLLFVAPSNPDAPEMTAMTPGYAEASLTLEDAKAIADLRFVEGTAPTNENFVEISYGNETKTSVVHGSTPQYLNAYNYELATGQFITDANVARRDLVVVLGSNVAEDLFGEADPVGQRVKMKDKRFTVIGVLEAIGGGMFGFSFDDVIVTPITTYQTRLFSQTSAGGEEAIQSVAVKVTSSEAMTSVTEDIEKLLRRRHNIKADEDNDFSIVSPEQILGVFESVTVGLTVFLGAIAAISLLVGSIGIMNIMLVSVTERTREIGLRKAIGAKRRDIVTQFLLEAATLSLVGGAVGTAGGVGVSQLISLGISLADLGFEIHAMISPFIVILAVSVSVIIGLASGIYPAMRAARLNPIDALRYG